MSDNNQLMKLWGNDEKRQSFLKDYREWGLWFTTPELGLTWFRYTMPAGDTIIAMEYEHEVFDRYPNIYKKKKTVRYYIQRKGKPFTPGSHSSISSVAALLKDVKVALKNEAKNNIAMEVTRNERSDN